MKRLVFLLWALCGVATWAMADGDDIDLQAGIHDPNEIGNDTQRSPIYIPSASIDDHTLYFGDHPDYVLQLVDPDDETVVYYETLLPAGTNTVVLPSVYSGEYIIQLLWGNWRIWGYINLP